MLYLVFLSVHLSSEDSEESMLWCMFFISIFLLIYDCMIFSFLIRNRVAYVQNITDIGRAILLVIYIIAYYSISHDEDEHDLEDLLTFLTLLSFGKGITYFRYFKGTRYLITLVTEVINDMKAFLMLWFYSIFAFCFIFLALNFNSKNDFEEEWQSSFMINLGDYNTEEFRRLSWMFFVLAALVNPVIMLNLLISIIGDTYDKV